jgi:hypothetical protein
VFGVVYAVTFLLGAVLLLEGPRAFIHLVAQRVGIRPFWLEPAELLANWLLILAAPALFAAGWFFWSRRPEPEPAVPQSLPLRPLVALYGVLLTAGVASLARGGALTRAASWLDYGYFIQSRFMLFDRLSFPEWMNLYALLPASAGLLVVGLARSGWKPVARRLAIGAVVTSLLVMDLLVFQKRYVVLSVIFLATCAAVNRPGVLQTRLGGLARIAAFGLALYLAFCALVASSTSRMTPVVIQGGTTDLLSALHPPEVVVAQTRPAPVVIETPSPPPEPARIVAPPLVTPPSRPRTYYGEIRWPPLRAAVARVFPGRWVGERAAPVSKFGDTFPIRFFFAVLAPVTRLAPPAIAYPALFPRVIGYFGLDVGSDIAGFGRMPDDNLVVYGAMYGQLDKGAISVPFPYSWYSQVGLFGALLLCFPLGAAAAAAWRSSLARARSWETRAVSAALVVMFTLHISQDSVRGSLLNAYGVLWGVLLVLAAGALLRARPALSDRQAR